jgi:ligand-binding sensor domain-containing protein
MDANQAMWVGTEAGLVTLNPYNGEVFGEVLGLPGRQTLAISPETGNKVWVGTREGLGWVSTSTGRGVPHVGYSNPGAL